MDAITHARRSTATRWSSRWCCSSALVLLGLLFVVTVPRLLNLFIKPSAVYPLYGFHDRIHRAIARMTGVKFFTHLFGDSSYIVYYLRWLGYDLSRVEQTGSNFGTDVGHENPYLSIDRQRDDGRRRAVDHERRLLEHVVPRLAGCRSGRDNFFGNNIAYPAGGRTGDNCLLATKAMIPLDGKVREGVGLLGSPCFEIPRTVERDQPVRPSPDRGRAAPAAAREEPAQPADHRRLPVRAVAARLPGHRVRAGRLRLVRRVRAAGDGRVLLALERPDHARLLRAGRARPHGRSGRCNRSTAPSTTRTSGGTSASGRCPAEQLPAHVRRHPVQEPGLARARRQGSASRVFDDGCYFTERTLTVIGDDCTLNAGSRDPVPFAGGRHVQVRPHHDRRRLHLGVGAMVHYGVTMGDGARCSPPIPS